MSYYEEMMENKMEADLIVKQEKFVRTQIKASQKTSEVKKNYSKGKKK